LISYKGTPSSITWKVGVSFRTPEQACANIDSEIGSSSFEDIVAQSKALWNEKLRKIELDLANTPENVVEMFYSSLYRASLTPVSGSQVPEAFSLA
jgi:putative alpha-1,2-mannosidase